jgi:hypothetical protein
MEEHLRLASRAVIERLFALLMNMNTDFYCFFLGSGQGQLCPCASFSSLKLLFHFYCHWVRGWT